MQHVADKTMKCDVCGKEEPSPGTFPKVIGVGRVCISCGMEKVKCDVCGEEVKRLTSSRFQGRNLCLKDHMKEVEKYKQHIVKVFDENSGGLKEIFRKTLEEPPEGYTLVTVRRARNSLHVWEAEYEKTEILQMRCS